MPRISRLHFAGVGHRDARFPALTLDLRGADGQPADSVIWAENGVGKSSLLTLFFSTYQTNRRQFLGARGVAKARELEHYVQERDLSFILTEWDITDDRGSASLLQDEPRELLVVGQMLSWKGLDRGSGDLRRRFFSFRPNRDISFESLPVAGLSEPVKSYEAFIDWLNARAKENPKLQIVHESNQSDWRAHLEACHLDPELFGYQLRMNLDEGGVNELFNELKEDKDFIRLFLELGLDPETPGKVRANLNEFVPQHRQLESKRAQVSFNERLLVELRLLQDQLTLFREAGQRVDAASAEAAGLLAAVHSGRNRLQDTIVQYEGGQARLEGEDRRLSSARDALRRRSNFFTLHRARLDVAEAEEARNAAEGARNAAQEQARCVAHAAALGELHLLESQAEALQAALAAEQEQARPEREALERLGAACKLLLSREAAQARSQQAQAEAEKHQLRQQLAELEQERLRLASEEAKCRQQVIELQSFFALRERQRDRLSVSGLLQPREEAAVAADRWRADATRARAEAERALAQRQAADREREELTESIQTLAREISQQEQRLAQIAAAINQGEQRQDRIATHPQMQAAVEAPRADLDLAATGDRLRERTSWLLQQVLRLSLEGAGDERAAEYVRRHGLFPPAADAEAAAEALRRHGVGTAAPGTHWLAFNVADPAAAERLLASDPARFTGVMYDQSLDGQRVSAVAPGLRTPHEPVTLSPLPIDIESPNAPADAAPLTASALTRHVALPRHAGAFNREAAQAELEALTGQMEARARDRDDFRRQHADAGRVLHDLEEWLRAFGNGQLALLREQRRGGEQALATSLERQSSHRARQAELGALAASLEQTEREQRKLDGAAQAAAERLAQFVEQFDAGYAAKRAELDALLARVRAAEADGVLLLERRQQLANSEPGLELRIAASRDIARDLEREAGQIDYAAGPAEVVSESLDSLRSRYLHDRERFEGRWLNTARQGEFAARQADIRRLRQTIVDRFSHLDAARAEKALAQGDVPGQQRRADETVAHAQGLLGAAEARLNQARDAVRNLPVSLESERLPQDVPVPGTAAEAAALLDMAQKEAVRLQSDHERTRLELGELKGMLGEARAHVERYSAQAKRLEDLDVTPGSEPTAVAEESRLIAMVDELCLRLRRARAEMAAERDKLERRHEMLREVVQSDEFARDFNIPARSLFAALTLSELMQGSVAEDRCRAVAEQTETLKAELAQMQQHRELIVGELLNEAEKAVSLLRRAERLSRLPDDMTGWQGEPFLRIHLALPHSQEDKLVRLRAYVDELLARPAAPDGVRLVFDAVLALATERGMDASILKPETQRRNTRYPVREMSGWSEGERTTVAILLYCTLVKLRAQSRGLAERRAQVSALLLDNPVGKASKPEFLEMHRWIAGALGVQLIYATGINDPQALSIFPNRIRLAKNRIVPQTGELAVGIAEEAGESVVTDVRIFDGNTGRKQG